MEMKRRFLFGALAIVLASCGGGGGDSPPAQRPSGTLGGKAFDNVLINSDIDVYSLGGQLLGSGKTDTDGVYEVALSSVSSQPVRIVASYGTYKEEATNKTVELVEGDHLYGYVNYTQGGSIATSITLYTSMAAGYAEYLMGLGVPALTAIDNANASVSQMIGVDIVNVVPADITDADNARPSLDSTLRYSFFTAAASPFTAWVSRENGRPEHEYYNSIKFASLAYQDIKHDGLLDGIAATGTVSMGVVAFSPTTYRHLLALNMLIIANSPNNRTGMTPSDLYSAAQTLNNSNHVAFGTSDIVELDAEKPIVANASWFAGETVAGDSVTLSVDVADTVGMSTAVFAIDGFEYLAPDPRSPEITFDSTIITDGIYPVVLTATNFAGGVQTFTRNITIANAGIAISDVHPANGESIRGTYLFRATVTDPIAVASVAFKLDTNTVYSPTDLNAPEQIIDTTAVLVTEGQHTFDIIATNQGGFQDTYSGNFIIDNTPPVIDWGLVDGSYLTGRFDFEATITDNLEIATANLLWDGNLKTNFVQGGKPTSLEAFFTINTVQEFEGEHSIAVEVMDAAGGITTEQRTVFLDWNPPVSNFITPSGEIILDDIELAWEASDTNGIAAQDIYFDGEHVITLGPDDRTYTLDPLGDNGVKNIALVVTDLAGKTSTSNLSVQDYHKPPELRLVSRCDSGGTACVRIQIDNFVYGDPYYLVSYSLYGYQRAFPFTLTEGLIAHSMLFGKSIGTPPRTRWVECLGYLNGTAKVTFKDKFDRETSLNIPNMFGCSAPA